MEASAFNQASALLYERGYSIIPIQPGTKKPGVFAGSSWRDMPSWSRYCENKATEREIDLWETWPNANIGLCLGAASDIVALDFDENIQNYHEKIIALLPPSIVKKRGGKGFTSFYRYRGEKNRKWAIESHSVLELLSTGRQTVMPPSVHPSGAHYQYLTPDKLEDINPVELEFLPENFADLVDSIFGVQKRKITPVSLVSDFYGEDSLQEAIKALDYIPSENYDIWVQIGMGLRRKFGDQAFTAWDNWSKKSTKYKHEEMSSKWQSFNSQGINIATIFYYAMQGGYIPKPLHIEIPKIFVESGGNLSVMQPKIKSIDFPIELATKAPGLVGEITKWILETSLQPQPALALAAAIPAVGVIMGHRLRSESDLRTNMLTLAVAPSGAGKDHPRKCIINLFKQSGLQQCIGGKPASGPGLLSSVFSGKGRRLLQIDEFGRVLKTLTSRSASSHHAEILTNIMEMFSSANTTYFGAEYANHDGKMTRKDIDQPCLCVYGSTVPVRFYDALTSDDAIDGFLSRWLVFESKDPNPKQQKPTADIHNPPSEILSRIAYLNDLPTNTQPTGGLDDQINIKPGYVFFSDAAKQVLEDYTKEIGLRKERAYKDGKGLEALWARAREHSIKLSILAHSGPDISAQVMKWAIDVTEYCLTALELRIEDKMSDNQTEKETKRLLEIIKQTSWIDHSTLTRRSYWLTGKRKIEIINTLLEAGTIEARDLETSGRKKRQYRAL